MTPDKALQTMVKLHAEGATYEQIADTLRKSGYKGPRSGKPLTPANIGNYVRQHSEKTGDASTSSQAPSSVTSLLPLETRVDLAVKLLTDTTWGTAEQRIIVGVNVLSGK